MDETILLAALRRHWEYEGSDHELSHEIYHDDAVLEFPQSQERFEGKANFLAWRKSYPASIEFKIRRIRGQGNFWVAENSIRYDGGPWNYSINTSNSEGTRSPEKRSMSLKGGRLPTGAPPGVPSGWTSPWASLLPDWSS